MAVLLLCRGCRQRPGSREVEGTVVPLPTAVIVKQPQHINLMPLPRFWEFAHLSDKYKDMGWLDKVPRAGKLYIGGLHALYQKPDLFEQAGISHIVSVIDYEVYETGAFKQYKYLMIRVDDDPNEELLKHFRESNAFIDDALSSGGGVFVHCAMGKSRSATIVCAYLMWKYGVDPAEALKQLCESRPVCSPNPGFMEQLGVFHAMLKAGDEAKAKEIYAAWRKDRFKGDWWTWERRAKESKESKL